MTGLVFALDIPNPIDVVTNVISKPIGWAWDKVAEGIAKWVLGAVAYFVEGVVSFLLTSSRPDVGAAWFSGAGSPYATVRSIAVGLLLLFVFLGIIQGLVIGDLSGMVRRVAADLPLAIIGMIATTVVTAKLLELTDALSAIVLSRSDDQAVHFLSGFGMTVTGATQGFAAVLVGLVAVIAGLFVWVELTVRSVLVYLLVALSPLSFAAMVWPSARGVLRRTVELLVAVIVSKLVICITLAVGVAALSGAGTAAGPDAGVGDAAAASMGTLFVGTAILAMAAFAPFLVLKLIPWAEAALVAQGMSRSPVRSAHSAMGTVHYAGSLSRLAGQHRTHAALNAGTAGWAVGAPALGATAVAGRLGAAHGAPLGSGTRAVPAADTATGPDATVTGPPAMQPPKRRSPGGTARPVPTRSPLTDPSPTRHDQGPRDDD